MTHAGGDPLENVVAVVFPKGGTGKTTTAVNLAGALVSLGRSVLLVDNDWQASASVHLGLKEPDDEPRTLADVLAGRVQAADAIRRQSSGVHLLVGSGELANVDLDLLAQGEAGIFRLANVLEPVADQYDVILIDCEPGLHVRNLGALAAADYLLVPVSADYLSLKPLRLFLRLLAAAQRRYLRFPHHRVGVLLTRFDARQTQALEVAEVLKDLAPGAGLDHFEVIIPERAAHRKAAQAGGPLTPQTGPGAGELLEIYTRLAEKVLAW